MSDERPAETDVERLTWLFKGALSYEDMRGPIWIYRPGPVHKKRDWRCWIAQRLPRLAERIDPDWRHEPPPPYTWSFEADE